MPDIPGTTREQTIFLRACSKDPFGLSGKDWPSPATFRRWMRRPGFRIAIKAMRDALRMQADLQLAAAAAAATRGLSRALIDEDGRVADEEKLAAAKEQINLLSGLLRMAHLRQRFAVDPKEKRRISLSPDVQQTVDRLREVTEQMAHNNMTVGEAREMIWRLDHPDGEEPESRESCVPWCEEGKNPFDKDFVDEDEE